jgi:ribokinase
MPDLLVIGGASIDKLHVRGQIVHSAGGTGLYTALAALRSGARVDMYGPRPDPMPEVLRLAADRLHGWMGPFFPEEEIAHFEISHEGDHANYIGYFAGREAEIDPNGLPENLPSFELVHITAMGNALQQRAFLQACLAHGARRISIGTFLKDVREHSQVVWETLGQADIFFMNEHEAAGIFGSLEEAAARPGQLLFITRGKQGVTVLQGDQRTSIPAVSSEAVDPTGAGDTFCGAALAHILNGRHPVMAAGLAARLAAQEIAYPGPQALLMDDPLPGMALDERVRVRESQVGEVSAVVRDLEAAAPFDFTGSHLPPAGHPAALAYFFAVTLQQFGFWETAGGRYDRPLIAPLDGDMLKGSTYLYRAFLRPLDDDPDFYSPERQANLTRDELLAVLRADDGSDPMPALDLHLEMAHAYGRDMLAHGLTPRTLLERAQISQSPLKEMLMMLDHIGGYKEDPLRKKSSLLALSLNQRPEGFLRFGEGENVSPVIDYHAMRGCLRSGLVEVLDRELYQKLADRRELEPDEEWAVRLAAYQAVERVVEVSGKSLGAVDWFFFNYLRALCPEMSAPRCAECALEGVCAKRKELFQPVFRTTFY